MRRMSPWKRNGLFLASALTFGGLLRLSTIGQVFEGPRPIPLSSDCVYHLRRARFALESFPKTVVLDPMINFPSGGVCIWPPLFDLSLAVPALLIAGRHASTQVLERSAMWVPLAYALGAIAAAGLAGLGLRRRTGILAAVFVALCPGHLHYSQLGHTDQHVAESLWGFLALGAFLQSCRRNSAKWDSATGFAIAAGVLTWQGAIFWAPVFALPLLAEAIFRPAKPSIRRILLILGVPTLLVAIGTKFWLLGVRAPFTFISFGEFQPKFLAVVFAATLSAAAVARARSLGPVRSAAALLAAGAAALPVLTGRGKFFSVVLDGVRHLGSATAGAETAIGFLRYPREWLAQIAEYRPLFAEGAGLPAHLLSFAFFAAPIALFFWWRRAVTRKSPAALALALWGTFTLVTTLIQRRNIYYAALLAALSGIEVAGRGAVWISRNRKVGRLAFAAIFTALAAPMLVWLPAEIGAVYRPGSDLLATLDWIKSSTPRRVDPYDSRFLGPSSPAVGLASAESIMAPWALGHFLTYFAERPVAADNFGYGFSDSVRFFLSTEESSALAIARERRSRYVVATDLSPKMNDYGAILGMPPFLVSTARGVALTPEYFRTVQSRLYDFDGNGGVLPDGTRTEPLAHFREVFASRTGIERFGRFIARWKVFEIR
jgi:asparagine N-glycosylation enzyme membrane subunit Stt3